jgi:hypothetical protein
MPVIRNKVTGKDELYLIGGGIFGVAVYFDDVWRFDGTYWFRVPPKPAPGAQPGWPTGLNPPERSGRKYHNVVLTPPGPDWPDGLLWVITGSIGGNGSSKTILVSRNVGATWEIFMIADWGIGGSHADAVTVFDGDIIRATGNAYDRSTYRIHQVSIKEWLARPAPPRVDGFVDPLDPGGPLVTSLRGKKDDEVMLKGANLKSALTVRVDPTSVNVIYVDPIPPVLDDTIRVSIPEAPAGVVPGTDTDSVFIVVVGPAGSSNFANAKFIYTAT